MNECKSWGCVKFFRGVKGKQDCLSLEIISCTWKRWTCLRHWFSHQSITTFFIGPTRQTNGITSRFFPCCSPPLVNYQASSASWHRAVQHMAYWFVPGTESPSLGLIKVHPCGTNWVFRGSAWMSASEKSRTTWICVCSKIPVLFEQLI